MASEAATERARRIAAELRQRWFDIGFRTDRGFVRVPDDEVARAIEPHITPLQAERDALSGQVAELKRDAERWRHIQSRGIVLIINGVPCRGAELDSAIDDEIRSSKPHLEPRGGGD